MRTTCLVLWTGIDGALRWNRQWPEDAVCFQKIGVVPVEEFFSFNSCLTAVHTISEMLLTNINQNSQVSYAL